MEGKLTKTSHIVSIPIYSPIFQIILENMACGRYLKDEENGRGIHLKESG